MMDRAAQYKGGRGFGSGCKTKRAGV